MGLLSIIRKLKRKEKSMRILMVGLDNAGKTSIVKRMNGEDISEISPTLGFNIVTMGFDKYQLNVWDVGGQKTLRPYWRNYYEQTDALVWVVDSCDVRRLEDCRNELKALLQEEKLLGATLLVLANKQDLTNAVNVEIIEKILELKSMDSDRHWKIFKCSAVNGEGILEAFHWLVDDVGSRIYMYD